MSYHSDLDLHIRSTPHRLAPPPPLPPLPCDHPDGTPGCLTCNRTFCYAAPTCLNGEPCHPRPDDPLAYCRKCTKRPTTE